MNRSQRSPSISFYLPELREPIPDRLDDYWEWQTTTPGLSPWWGRYHWVLQTYLHLRASGYPCELTTQIPRSGILITHKDCLPPDMRPRPDLVVVCLLVDRTAPHPYAHFHVVHRDGQSLGVGHQTIHIPAWPQAALIPRDPARGDRFETVGYFGYEHNLAPQLWSPEFQDQLQQLGLRFYAPPPARWPDFSGVDVILAVRQLRLDQRLSKSAVKLVNAWHAGVPAVLGHEAGFRTVRNSPLDYLEASSVDQILESLRRLKNDASLRQQMAAHGRQRAREFSAEQLRARWHMALTHTIVPYYDAWQHHRGYRTAFSLQREGSRALHGLSARLGLL